MLSPALAEFVQSGLSTIVGSSSPDGRPQCMRGIGLVVCEADRGCVFLPCVAAGPTLQNLGSNRRIAVSLSQLGTHKTVQLKGAVNAIRLAAEQDRPDLERLFERIIERLSFVGFPRAVIQSVNRWPSWHVEFEVREVFLQTPGPQAGLRLGGEVTWT